MQLKPNPVTRAGKVFLSGALFLCLAAAAQTVTTTNVNVRVMAANITSGDFSSYETPGINIFKGLKPDIVAIQEFKYNNSSASNQLRQLVNTAFGTNFYFFCETNSPAYNIPNGIISRYPFVTNGSMPDPDTGVNDRGFAWAQIRLPGTNDLYVVSVHLKSGTDTSPAPSDATRRATEATNIVQLIQTFPADAWVIVAEDFNIHSPTEAALNKFKTVLSDSPIPTDAVSGGNANTSAPRSERYDYVLPSFSFTNRLTNVVIGAQSFSKGLVFDSDVYTPLADVSPVVSTDSHVTGMQHMGVVKDFRITYYVTNSGIAPVITNQPQSLTVTQGNNAPFTVVAGGTAPLNYQWRFTTTNLASATSSSYTRSNAQPVHLGNYSVVVTNAAGSVTSTPAALGLHIPTPTLTIPAPDRLQWQGLSNLNYTVQSKTNVTDTNWIIIGTASSPTATLSFTNAIGGAPQRFYRVVYP